METRVRGDGRRLTSPRRRIPRRDPRVACGPPARETRAWSDAAGISFALQADRVLVQPVVRLTVAQRLRLRVHHTDVVRILRCYADAGVQARRAAFERTYRAAPRRRCPCFCSRRMWRTPGDLFFLRRTEP